ncbi:MAG: hypothetical protein QOK15_2205 [Nocardioidaceae bacterium]|jgi:hypothetical protein|nr:hypothetical protein [Nocardioidaceae bacterium]
MTAASPDAPGLVAALEDLRLALAGLELPLELPGVDSQRAARREMLGQLEDYVLPRLRQIEAPLLAVVGGSTGAGKSTLVNSVVGRKVTEPGVLRPTTRSPVLAFNPADAGWFDDGRILPELARTTAASADPRSLQLVGVDSVPAGLAVLDAPDIDSVEARNRELATQLLAAADLWLFVTSAARYADQVPWDFLRAAADRSAAVAIVLDRIPPGAEQEVAGHLREMLQARGLERSPLFTVRERTVDADGLLDAGEVAEIRTWLEGLAADATARAAVVRQTLDGAVRSVARRSDDVAAAHAAQVDMVRRLRADVGQAYDRAVREVDDASADGSLLRGEVLARWQEFVGTGELLRSLETRVGRLRDRVGGWIRGKPHQVERVTVAVESGLESLLVEHAEAAAEDARRSWTSVEAGKRLLQTADPDLGRASRDFRRQAERAVRDWQQGVLDMVRTEGADRRTTARFLAFGVNGLSVALMIVVFAHTAGVTGAEAGIAGGSAVLGQKLLEAVFGDQAVRRLAEQARTDLEQRVTELYAGEGRRFLDVLDGLHLDDEGTDRLRHTAADVDRLRLTSVDGGGA